MPSLGADMEAGTVVEWRVRPGDVVHRGDIVALVETEKGLIEVEIFESGTIERIVVPAGNKVPVGTVLAIVAANGGATAAATAPILPPTVTPSAAPPPSAAVAPPRARVSPLARRRAAEFGVDLATITGSGANGAITERDVEQAAPPPAPPAAPPVDRQAAMRAAIAAAMARSKREIPHYYLATQIDMRRAMDWLSAANLERPLPQRLLPSALLVRAVALAVREVPDMNGFWVDGAFRPGAGIHVGVAIALRQGGLVAPALHDVDRLDLDTLMARLLDLVKRARAGVLRSSEVTEATITVTNLGDLGVETVFGVIYPPQVALVGFGKITGRPWAADGMLGVRPIVTASLAADHRASDGHRGGRFLTAIDRLLQEPERL